MRAHKPRQKKSAGGKRNLSRVWLVLGAGILALLIIAAIIAFPRLGLTSAAAPVNTPGPSPTDAAPFDAAPALGPANAPVTIIEYGDFGCTTCLAWYKLGVLQELRARYGDQIRFVWRDFPVITLASPDAAEAGQCAHAQGKFWQFHDLVYENNGAIEAADLQSYATKIGLDMKQYTECVTSHRYQALVVEEKHRAFQLGFNGTPSFVVNGQPLVGAQPASVFEALIDPILASQK